MVNGCWGHSAITEEETEKQNIQKLGIMYELCLSSCTAKKDGHDLSTKQQPYNIIWHQVSGTKVWSQNESKQKNSNNGFQWA